MAAALRASLQAPSAGGVLRGGLPAAQPPAGVESYRWAASCPIKPQGLRGSAASLAGRHAGGAYLAAPQRRRGPCRCATARGGAPSGAGQGRSDTWRHQGGPAGSAAGLEGAHESSPSWQVSLLQQALRRSLPVVCAAALAALPLWHPRAALAAGAAFASSLGGGSGGQLLVSAWTGLVAGCLHTLTGPDHLAALAPLAIGRTRMQSAAVGALWGFGHDTGQLLFGLLFVLLKDRLHLDLLRTWGSRVVALTLVAIGAMGIHEARTSPALALAGTRCAPGDDECWALAGPDGVVAAPRRRVGVATFVTGIVHGLQPDALLIVLPALALPSKVAGAAFLATFLLGTVLSMGGYTAFIGSCSDALQKRAPGVTRRLSWGAALLAIAFGVLILCGELLGFTLF